MELKINIDYKRKSIDGMMSNAELTANYIEYAAKKKYPDGLKSMKLRLFARIQNKLDDALIAKSDSITIETAEADLLKEMFKGEIAFPTQAAKYVILLIDEIDKLGEEKK